MQLKLSSFARLCMWCAIVCCTLLPLPSPAEQCEPLYVTERGAGLANSSAMPVFPRLNIESPGRFCLGQDVQQGVVRDGLRRTEVFAREEAIVRIRASSVTVDFRGHTVSNAMQKGMTAIWFSKFAHGERDGVRLRDASILNGNLISPFSVGIGIDLTASKPYGAGSLQIASIPAGSASDDFFEDTGHLIDSMSIIAGKRAILIDGRNNVIRNNRITVDAATAIIAQGPGIIIENNVIEVRNHLEMLSEHDRRLDSKTPFVIRLIQADGAIVRNNQIRLLGRSGRESLPAAIELVRTTGAVVEGNVFGGVDTAVHADDASSYREDRNVKEPCPGDGTRFLPPDETGESPRPPAAACR